MVGFCSSVRNRKSKKGGSGDSEVEGGGIALGSKSVSSPPSAGKSTDYTVSANMSHSHAHSSSTTNVDVSSTHDKKLVHMGLATALSIAIHNFPEGLATFVATVDDPSVGATLAIAIAVHNIPEGLCVSIPIYYATGDRRKAFLWGLLSGVTEPIGAALGWAILAGAMSDVVYGIMFGLVAGMMVRISIKEVREGDTRTPVSPLRNTFRLASF